MRCRLAGYVATDPSATSWGYNRIDIAAGRFNSNVLADHEQRVFAEVLWQL